MVSGTYTIIPTGVYRGTTGCSNTSSYRAVVSGFTSVNPITTIHTPIIHNYIPVPLLGYVCVCVCICIQKKTRVYIRVGGFLSFFVKTIKPGLSGVFKNIIFL